MSEFLGDQDYTHLPSLPFLRRAPQIRLSLGAAREKISACSSTTTPQIGSGAGAQRGRSGTTRLAPGSNAEQHELLMLWAVADRED
jgi:hypothetical protein